MMAICKYRTMVPLILVMVTNLTNIRTKVQILAYILTIQTLSVKQESI